MVFLCYQAAVAGLGAVVPPRFTMKGDAALAAETKCPMARLLNPSIPMNAHLDM